MLVSVIVLGIFGLFSTGCMSHGTKVEASKVDKIEKGVTTRAEVEQMLGPADSVFVHPDASGKRTMQYFGQQSQVKAQSFIPGYNMFASGAKTQRQNLQILIGSDGKVLDYEYTSREGEITTGVVSGSTEREVSSKSGAARQ